MYQTIMVPLDGSSFSEHALPLALRIARLRKAALHLVRVSDMDHRPTDSATHDTQSKRAYLAGIADRLAASWHGLIATALLDGPVTKTLVGYAEPHQIDLLTATTHGRGALTRAWLGSVADRLIRQLPMPMLLVRPHETDPTDLANPRSSEYLLLPLDGSERSAEIIASALALGRLTGARYILIQAVAVVAHDYGFGTYSPADISIATWIQEAHRYLDRLATGLRAEGQQVQTDVAIGPTAIVILDYAREHLVDLIALATHGRIGGARLVLGRVADKIVRGAGVPLRLHRPPAAIASEEEAEESL
jgi:nucleotide-binding universal stress UspA family protein